MLGYEAVADELRALGTDTVFGLMGDGNMHWVTAFLTLPGTTWVPSWHEAGAIGMADGWVGAMPPGTLGVATVTMGPGLVQGLGAITAAARTRTPLLVVCSAVEPADPPHAQHAEQRTWVEACGAAYDHVDDVGAVRGAVRAAARRAVSEERPVVLSIPADLMARQVPEATGRAEPTPDRRPADGPDDNAIRRAAQLLVDAEAPVVVLGRGALDPRAQSAAVDLSRVIGAAVVTTLPANGAATAAHGHLGLTGMMAGAPARARLRSADVVLVVGVAADRYNTDGGGALAGARVVRVDRRTPDALWDPPAVSTLHLTGDSAAVLQRLVAALPERGGTSPAPAEPGADHAAAHLAELAALAVDDGPNPWAVVAAIDAAVPDDAHVVIGIGHFWYFVAPYLRSAGRTFDHGLGFAMIGQALPLAVGAAVALRDRPVVVVEGDGSLPMNVVELQTAVRMGVDLLVVVLDNAAYGSEVHKLRLSGLDPDAASFADPLDHVAVATALGAEARRADDVEQLQEVLADLVPRTGVRVVVAAISRSTMSEVYERQHG